MGTWGYSVASDDTVADIVDLISNELKTGKTLADAIDKARQQFAELEHDADEAPQLWLAIAHAQWKWGVVDTAVLSRVREDIQTEQGLERWKEDEKALAKRRNALVKFLAQIECPNPKPAALPKFVIRQAPFRKGDCLAVQMTGGQFAAALVLNEDNSRPEHGMNLVATLDYLATVPPSLDVFKRRDWLVLHQGVWNGKRDISWYLPTGFREIRKRTTLVGNISLKWLDPKSSAWHTSWRSLCEQMQFVSDHRGLGDA